jgi:polyisoprenoid-binding protein YceI
MAKWVIDADHSVVKFSIWHFMIANLVSYFGRITGMIQFVPPDTNHLLIEAEIEARSITADHQMEDECVLSPDYFDVEKYPKIIFRSTKVDSATGNRCKVTGGLDIRGIIQPVILESEVFGPIENQLSGKSCIRFNGKTRINCEDYGMMRNKRIEGVGFVMGKDVQIDFDIEAALIADQ